ncbi:beta-mannase, partial [Trichoderma reesei RUT C-30]|uniref:Mannan endo-1,4-beta-mannosidase A n=3 Tax=Hypocrea jecorina TaxID=51453 RepID=MANA_HYPJR
MMMLSKSLLSAATAASALAAVLQPVPRASSFVTISGTQFNIDGKVGYFAGTNCYWCSFLTNHADVDSTFSHISSSGLKVVRVWGFNDVNTQPSPGQIWFQKLSATGSTINTGADGLQTLDYVVQSAEQHNLKLIIPFVNNWSDYGGINAYVNAFGGNATTWYTNTAAQTQYRKYVQAVVSRYANSTAIFAWELGNEPRCNGCSTDVIVQWATSVSQYVKSLDSNHLVTLGDEGLGLSTGDGAYPYTYGEGTDFAKNVQIKSLDFGTFHLYPDSWGTNYTWGNGWIQTHAAACLAAGKPCVFEEYGAQQNPCTNEAPWQTTSLTTRGMGGDMFWQWGDTFANGAQSNSDPYTVWYNSSNWQCLVKNHVDAINGGTTTPPPVSSTTTTSSRTSSTPPPPGGSCSPLYGQCGGSGYTGPTCCAQGTCIYSNYWYSQCLNT